MFSACYAGDTKLKNFQSRQNAGVNNTNIVKISSLPISMAKLSITLAVEFKPA